MGGAGLVFVADIGATKVRYGLAGKGMVPDVVPTPTSYFSLVRLLVSESRRYKADALCVACPGLVSRNASVAISSLYTCLDGQTLAADLQARIDIPVSVANDANAVALGASAVANYCFVVVVGTAVGGAITTGAGDIYDGERGYAGEVGHIHVPEASKIECPCGLAGCLDTVASGWSLERDLGPRWYENRLRIRAQQRLELAANAICSACYTVSALLDPRLILIAGHLSSWKPFRHAVVNALSERSINVDLTVETWPFIDRWATIEGALP